MNVKELQDVLRGLEEVYASAGAKKQAGGIAALVKSIDGNPDMSVDDLIADIRQRLSVNAVEENSAAPRVNMSVVDSYANKLAAAGTERTGFDRAFGELKADPEVKPAEAFAIANRYQNDPVGSTFLFKFASKREAFDFIFDTYISRAQAESKAGIIERTTKWMLG